MVELLPHPPTTRSSFSELEVEIHKILATTLTLTLLTTGILGIRELGCIRRMETNQAQPPTTNNQQWDESLPKHPVLCKRGRGARYFTAGLEKR